MAHGLEFFFAGLQTAFEVVDGALGVVEIQANIFARFQIIFELQPAVGPEGDLFGEALMDSGEGFVHMGDAALGDFLVVLGNKCGCGESQCPLLLARRYPRLGKNGLDEMQIA